ncbi:MAG TPA: YggS family pyridoxal phosphate-dependent enzyme [Candidatus Limnocylindrales bacterium]|nr:YggS family pyridoxal phosphate-dependent enzyme [Candidatus Limnocylindrales bacterium]
MLAENYRRVKTAIVEAAQRVNRDASVITLIAVTKTVGLEAVSQAAALGINDFGENRLQEAMFKVDSMPELRWHFIGHLQTNKVKDVLARFALIHSLDRLSLADELQRCAERSGKEAAVLIQVNVSSEQSKYGLAPDDLAGFLEALKSHDRLRVQGLMTMAPYVDDPEETRQYFRQLRLLQELHSRPGQELKELSMGMTNDFTIAVEEGATMVRIGSALFES